MPPNSSSAGTADLRGYLDRALGSPRGIRITGLTKMAATRLRQRIYTFRARDRIDSTKVYSPGDPAYGRSAYDCLYLDIDENNFLLIRKTSSEVENVEDL